MARTILNAFRNFLKRVKQICKNLKPHLKTLWRFADTVILYVVTMGISFHHVGAGIEELSQITLQPMNNALLYQDQLTLELWAKELFSYTRHSVMPCVLTEFLAKFWVVVPFGHACWHSCKHTWAIYALSIKLLVTAMAVLMTWIDGED